MSHQSPTINSDENYKNATIPLPNNGFGPLLVPNVKKKKMDKRNAVPLKNNKFKTIFTQLILKWIKCNTIIGLN